MFDENGYLTDKYLKKIATWKIKSIVDCALLLAEAKSAWAQQDTGWKEREIDYVVWYRLSIQEDSNNRFLAYALQENFAFWNLCWQRTSRGGHYLFRVGAFC